MALKDTVKQWFKTKLKPTQAQFYTFFDSIRWKDEKVATSDVDGLDVILAGKAERSVLSAVKSDVSNIKIEVEKGLKVMEDISLDGIVSEELILPQKALVKAIRINGDSSIIVGSTEGQDDIADNTSTNIRYVDFGFLTNTSIWLKSDKPVTITPIIFQM